MSLQVNIKSRNSATIDGVKGYQIECDVQCNESLYTPNHTFFRAYPNIDEVTTPTAHAALATDIVFACLAEAIRLYPNSGNTSCMVMGAPVVPNFLP